MATRAGTAYVQILPDMAGFNEKLRAQLDKDLKQVKAKVKVDVEADPRQVAGINAQIDKVKLKLDELSKKKATPEITIETGKAAAELHRLEAELDKLRFKEVKIPVKADTSTLGQAEQHIKSFADRADKGGFSIDRLGAGITKLYKQAALISAVGIGAQAVSALGAAAIATTASLAPLAGGLAAYPAIASAGGQALGTWKLAFSGVSTAVGGLNSQINKNSQAWKSLTPEGKKFAEQLQAMKKPLQDLSAVSQKNLMPGLAEGMRVAMANFPIFKQGIADTAKTIGGLAVEAGKLVGSKGFGKDLQSQMAANDVTIRRLGEGGLHLANALLQVVVAAQPLVDWMTKVALSVSKNIEQWAIAGRKSGEFAAFFRQTRDVMTDVGKIAVNLGGALVNIFKGAYPVGKSLLDILTGLSGKFKDWTGSAKGQNAIKKFFDDAKPAMIEAGKLVGAVLVDLGKLGQGAQVAPILYTIRTQLLPAFYGLVQQTTKAFGPAFVSALTQVLLIFTKLGGSSGGLVLSVNLFGKIASSINWLLDNIPFLGKAVLAIGVVGGISKALGLASAIGTVTRLYSNLKLINTLGGNSFLGKLLGWKGAQVEVKGMAKYTSIQAATLEVGDIIAKNIIGGGAGLGGLGGGASGAKGAEGGLVSTFGKGAAGEAEAAGKGILSKIGPVLKLGMKGLGIAGGAFFVADMASQIILGKGIFEALGSLFGGHGKSYQTMAHEFIHNLGDAIKKQGGIDPFTLMTPDEKNWERVWGADALKVRGKIQEVFTFDPLTKTFGFQRAGQTFDQAVQKLRPQITRFTNDLFGIFAEQTKHGHVDLSFLTTEVDQTFSQIPTRLLTKIGPGLGAAMIASARQMERDGRALPGTAANLAKEIEQKWGILIPGLGDITNKSQKAVADAFKRSDAVKAGQGVIGQIQKDWGNAGLPQLLSKTGNNMAVNFGIEMEYLRKRAATTTGKLHDDAVRDLGRVAAAAKTYGQSTSNNWLISIANAATKSGGSFGDIVKAGLSQLSKLPPGARRQGEQSMIQMAAGLEAKKDVPGGTTAKTIADIAKNDFGSLPPKARRQGEQSMIQMAAGLEAKKDVPAGTTSKTIADIAKNDFGSLPPKARKQGEQSMIQMSAGLEAKKQVPAGTTAGVIADIAKNDFGALPPKAKIQGQNAMIQLSAGLESKGKVPQGTTLKVMEDIDKNALAKLPPSARQRAFDTMTQMSQSLEKNGVLPKGTTDKLVAFLEGKYDNLKSNVVGSTAKLGQGASGNLSGLASAISSAAQHIGDQLNGVLGGLNVPKVTFKTTPFTDPFKPIYSGPSTSSFFHYGGGWLGARGMVSANDNIPISPFDVAAMGEAVVTRHQAPAIEAGMQIANAVTGGQYPFSSLDQVFGSITQPHGHQSGGLVSKPPLAPLRHQAGGYAQMVGKANEVDSHHYPYLWGGGHDANFSPPYDCSGAVSSVLHAGGVLGAPAVSGAMAGMYQPGPGLVTLYANPDHVYMSLGGKFWGTSNSNPGGGAGWFAGAPRPGFAVRHVPATGGMVDRLKWSGGTDMLRSIGQADTDKIVTAANNKINKVVASMGSVGGGNVGEFNVPGSPAAARGWTEAAMKLTGVSGSAWENMLLRQELHESTYNPNSINTTDSNAARGDPSIGIMQTTGSTFRKYEVAGHTNIRNPVDNIAAAINYIIARYGGGNANAGLQWMINNGGRAYQHGGRLGGRLRHQLGGKLAHATGGFTLPKLIKPVASGGAGLSASPKPPALRNIPSGLLTAGKSLLQATKLTKPPKVNLKPTPQLPKDWGDWSLAPVEAKIHNIEGLFGTNSPVSPTSVAGINDLLDVTQQRDGQTDWQYIHTNDAKGNPLDIPAIDVHDFLPAFTWIKVADPNTGQPVPAQLYSGSFTADWTPAWASGWDSTLQNFQVNLRLGELAEYVNWEQQIEHTLEQIAGPQGADAGLATELINDMRRRVTNRQNQIKKWNEEIAKRQAMIRANLAQIATDVAKIASIKKEISHLNSLPLPKSQPHRNQEISARRDRIAAWNKNIGTLNTDISGRHAQNRTLGGSPDSVGTEGQIGQYTKHIGELTDQLGILGDNDTGYIHDMYSDILNVKGASGQGGSLNDTLFAISGFDKEALSLSPASLGAEFLKDIPPLTPYVAPPDPAPVPPDPVDNGPNALQQFLADLEKTMARYANEAAMIQVLQQQVLQGSGIPLSGPVRPFPFAGSYATGGVVPGMPGQPMTIIAHGGEVVVPANQTEVGFNQPVIENHMHFHDKGIQDLIDVRVENRTRRQARSAIRGSGLASTAARRI